MLNKQNIPVSFTQGIDTKSDPKQVMMGSLLELENGVFTKSGAINKRYGYDALGTNIEGSTVSITSAEGIDVFNNELLLYDGYNAYTYSDSTSKWSNRGRIQNIISDNTNVIKNDYAQTYADSNSTKGIECIVWEDARGGIRYAVRDVSTSNFILQDQVVSSEGYYPKVVSFSNEIVIFYALSGGNLVYRRISPATPSVLGPEISFSTTINSTNTIYDVVTTGTRLFAVYNGSSSNTELVLLEQDFTKSLPVTTAGSASVAIHIFTDPLQRLWVCTYDGTEINAYAMSYALNSLFLPTTLEIINNVTRIAGALSDSINNIATIYYEVSASKTYDTLIRSVTVNSLGTKTSPGVFKRSVGLASKVFTYKSSIFLNVTYEGGLQNTYFTVNSYGDIISRVNYSVGGGLLGHSLLPEVFNLESNIFKYSNLVAGRLQSQDNTIFTVYGVNSTQHSFSTVNNFMSAMLGNNLHTVGGMLQAYDGVSFVEHNFNIFPHDFSVTATATTGGNLTDGNYLYTVTYEWTDNYGQIHRSGTGIPITVTLSGGTSTQTVTLKIPTLRLTNKVAPRPNARVVIYRTENNGTLYYRTSSATSPIFNNVTTDSVSFTDTTSDANLISNELIYTTGGIIDNTAAPTSSLAVVWKSRIILAGLEDPNQLWYSKARVSGDPIAFTASFTLQVDPKGGNISALGNLDNYLVIFKPSSIFLLTGQGPDDTGASNDYVDPELLTSDVGCIEPASVVTTPSGLLFKSAKGIYLLDRSLAVSYIGARVEAYNSYTITSADLVGYTNQVRFTTLKGTVLVYDYYYGQWSTFPNINAIDSVNWVGSNQRYVYVNPNGSSYIENTSSFLDAGKPIKLKLTTGWLSFAGLQNFQRVSRLILLGEHKGGHKLRVQFAYDFIDAYIQETLIDVSSIINPTAYGAISPYGSDPSYGGDGNLYQFRIHLTQQKCEAIKVSIEDSQSTNYNEGYSISSFNFEAGLKMGQYKLGTSRTFGTS